MSDNTRPICECGKKCAINYKKDGKYYYRKKCNSCLRKESKSKVPDWKKSGYVKKMHCEKCNFKAKYEDQITVYQLNNLAKSFKSVCLNCKVDIDKNGWQSGDLTPDF